MTIEDRVNAAIDSVDLDTVVPSVRPYGSPWLQFDPQALQAVLEVYRRNAEDTLFAITLCEVRYCGPYTDESSTTFKKSLIAGELRTRLQAPRARTYTESENVLAPVVEPPIYWSPDAPRRPWDRS